MKKKSLIDPPEMPRDFWNYPYNPITGMISSKGTSGSKARELYSKLIKQSNER